MTQDSVAPRPRYHAFLSHAHTDKEFADRLYRLLNDISGLEIWYDRKDLPPGQTLTTNLRVNGTRDLYVSRSWRPSEASLADAVCHALMASGFWLVGDATDHEGFDERRIASIMKSCGGFVAIAPHRGDGSTSEGILREIELARNLGLPSLVVAEPDVSIPDSLHDMLVRLERDFSPPKSRAFSERLDVLTEQWQAPKSPHYVFLATDLDDHHRERNRAAKLVLQSVTAMPCILGEEIREGHVQEVIVDHIDKAQIMLADISNDNVNTCIEAGIRRGAGGHLYLLARKEPGGRGRPPFMFRDKQVWHYQDDLELLARIHKVARPHRRRVFNLES